MKTLTVNLGSRSYPIYIGTGLLDNAGKYIAEATPAKRAAIVTDENIWGLYGRRLTSSLSGASIMSGAVILPPGEQSKSLDGLSCVYKAFADMGLKRDSIVISFGGGIPGDLGGFAAATYMRGLSFVQIPTTLLAQVDSSVGGKTAINLPEGKNLVGAFHQPICVISDTSLLSTLDNRNFRCGMAEIIKHGVLDGNFFSKLESAPHIDKIIYANCDIKRRFVEDDEYDKGTRMMLNLGHTFGHAIETLGHFKKYNHGEAVALGMIVAARLGEKIGITTPAFTIRLRALLGKYDIETDADFELSRLYPLLISDKKNEESFINLILPKDIGDVAIHKIHYFELEKTLGEL